MGSKKGWWREKGGGSEKENYYRAESFPGAEKGLMERGGEGESLRKQESI